MPDFSVVNRTLLDRYCRETRSAVRGWDRISMTADPTDADRDIRLAAAHCGLRSGYHVPHQLADPAPRPSTHGLGAMLTLTPVGDYRADTLQARLCIELLEAELADMRTQLATTSSRGMRITQSAEARRELVRARADEVTRLLAALAARFPNA